MIRQSSNSFAIGRSADRRFIGSTVLGFTAAGLLTVALTLAPGCGPVTPQINGAAAVASTPDQRWRPPTDLDLPAPGTFSEKPAITASKLLSRPLSLTAAVELALRRNRRTRAAWQQAQAAAQQLGLARAAYYPTLTGSVNAGFNRSAAGGGRFYFAQAQYGPALNLSWLVLDFGGIKAGTQAARAALIAANLRHNSALQDVVLQVTVAWYRYASALAMVAAAQADVANADASLKAAKARKNAGTTDLGDVLRAETAVAQAQLGVDNAMSQARSLRGVLASAMGLAATSAVQVQPLPPRAAVLAVTQDATALIDAAVKQRPDLAAAKAAVLQARHQIAVARNRGLPSLSVSARTNLDFFINSPYATAALNYGGTVDFSIPIFNGFATRLATRQADHVARAADESARDLTRQVALDVFRAWSDARNAANQVRISGVLLQKATRWETYATGQFQAGVGTILDALNAQAALAGARAREIQARAGWLLAMAQLAHATGALSPNRTPAQALGLHGAGVPTASTSSTHRDPPHASPGTQ